VTNYVVVLALAASGIFSGIAPAFGQAGNQSKPAAGVEPSLEVTTAWFPQTIRFGRQEIRPTDGHVLLAVALWVKNGKGQRLTFVEANADRAMVGLSVSWDNGVGVFSSKARLSDASGVQLEPLGVVVGESMAFFKAGFPGRTDLASEVNLGDVPARLRNKPASLLLIFDLPKGASGLQLNMGTAVSLPVPLPAP
jgi:hypothetical protein